MHLTSDAAAGGETDTIVSITPALPAGEEPMSAREAARVVAKHRRRKPDSAEPSNSAGNEQSIVPAAAPAPAPTQELADEADAAPDDQPSGETQAIEPEQDLPPIEPPRSWTTEEKERFKSLPRDLQAYLSEREQERDRDVRRRQNEAADERKAAQAEREAVARARQEYEAALPALLASLQHQQAGEFADIRTPADIEKLAREDFPRYVRWDAQQKRIAALGDEARAVQQRLALELSQHWAHFTQQQDQLFADKVPDIADPDKAPKLRESAVNVLKDRGFTEQELAQLWNGQAAISLRDHRLQLVILDAVKFSHAQRAAKDALTKPVPPVQRPGVAQQKSNDAEIQALNQKLERTGSARDAAALVAAQRRSRRA
jgi:hypothetical protein